MEPKNLLEFLAVMEQLKCNTRHSWTSTGRQESVSEHCHRLCIMALVLRDRLEGVDMERVLKMCLVHDFGEAITGDIPAFDKTEADEIAEERAVKDVLKPLDEGVGGELGRLFAEMQEMETIEAKVTRALDKLETLIQHNHADLATWLPLEYQANQGYATQEAQCHPYLTQLEQLIKAQTINKIQEI